MYHTVYNDDTGEEWSFKDDAKSATACLGDVYFWRLGMVSLINDHDVRDAVYAMIEIKSDRLTIGDLYVMK